MPKIINHHNFYFILLIILSLIIFLIQFDHPSKRLDYNEEKVKIWEGKRKEFNSEKKPLDMGDFSNQVVPRADYGLKPLAYLSTYNEEIVIAAVLALLIFPLLQVHIIVYISVSIFH